MPIYTLPYWFINCSFFHCVAQQIFIDKFAWTVVAVSFPSELERLLLKLLAIFTCKIVHYTDKGSYSMMK